MCLIVFAYQQHPEFELILATNRDEFYGRPTRSAQFWHEHPQVLAGKDLNAGGTWMGINRQGHFAALTNYRDPSIIKQNPPSRGELVLDYLTEKNDPRPYLQTLHQQSQKYMGFNILTGTPGELLHYSNQEQKINKVAPGIHGLSNHLLDTPWPKIKRSKSSLKKLLQSKDISEERLFEILRNDRTAEERDLPQTGISHDLEKKVSPIFIKSDDYGTRSSTILLIHKNGRVTFEERRFKTGTMEVDATNRFEFDIDI